MKFLRHQMFRLKIIARAQCSYVMMMTCSAIYVEVRNGNGGNMDNNYYLSVFIVC